MSWLEMGGRSALSDLKRRLEPLKDGERLGQPTFHARYVAMPDGTRAELIGGVVRFPAKRITASEGTVRVDMGGVGWDGTRWTPPARRRTFT